MSTENKYRTGDIYRFICSSAYFLKFLQTLNLAELDLDHELTLKVKKSVLSFPAIASASMEITMISRGADEFEREISVMQLNRLMKVLLAIEDQPLTVTIKKDFWIQINDMIL